ncbi:hypothetical protein DdX_18967 [Ditylenchus destructor]|uniref:Uncharacterized protein n=1 Tax=Ditylenchus destructor TaxID=166010 RepID=A0AAD4QXT6_9BILA|nr:hypothetical protein DdX_18967 [Ditylenchus destructor]
MDSLAKDLSKKCGLTDSEKFVRFSDENVDEFQFAGKILCGSDFGKSDETNVQMNIFPLGIPDGDIYSYNFFCFGRSARIDRESHPNENPEHLPLSQRFSLPLWETDKTDASIVRRQELLGCFYGYAKQNIGFNAVFDFANRIYSDTQLPAKELQIPVVSI